MDSNDLAILTQNAVVDGDTWLLADALEMIDEEDLGLARQLRSFDAHLEDLVVAAGSLGSAEPSLNAMLIAALGNLELLAKWLSVCARPDATTDGVWPDIADLAPRGASIRRVHLRLAREDWRVLDQYGFDLSAAIWSMQLTLEQVRQSDAPEDRIRGVFAARQQHTDLIVRVAEMLHGS